ncbi:MAG TPA: peptidase S10 [Blastocatellia bacterium]|nr:peptidase S10 [Blastocatellia bacterium]
MRRRTGTPQVLALTLLLVSGSAGAVAPVPRRPLPPTPQPVTPEIATTRHQVTIGRRVLRYTARAGFLPIRHNETGEVHGQMFFIAYLLDQAPGAPPRPLTFLWNGGPGANSVLVHLIGFGPKRLRWKRDLADEAGCDLVTNETTWLDLTDLVFVDPVGTGFSRPTRSEYAAEFYNTLGDIASVAEFVRVYLTRFDAWDAPLVLGGESYGVWRAAGVAEALLQRGIPVAGVILISGGIPVGPVMPEEMRTALFIPSRTAAAFYHRKLPPDLQTDLASALAQAETWARTEYAPALARRDHLTDEQRERIVNGLARYTGIAPSLIDRKTLVIPRQQFVEQLLAGEKKVLARFDTRQIRGSEPDIHTRCGLTINRYLRQTLNVATDLAYQGIEEGFSPPGERPLSVNARWVYNQAPPPPPGTPLNTDAPPGGSQPWLRRAMQMAPAVKVFVATGLYDSLNSCAVHAEVISRLEPPLRQNITARCYEGGHAMYETESVREPLKRDISAFYRDVVAGHRAGASRSGAFRQSRASSFDRRRSITRAGWMRR